MSEQFDLLITNATIVDGTGKPRFNGSVGVKGDRIAAVGDFQAQATRTIDGTGLVLSPGFIDSHSHIDLNIMQYPDAWNFVSQGVTTAIGGNCGHGRAPVTDCKYRFRWLYYVWTQDTDCEDPSWTTMDGFLSAVQQNTTSINFGTYVGHGSLRIAAMGDDFMRAATPAEVTRMKDFTQEAMEAGAFGIGTGVDNEGEYGDPEEEVVELCKIVAKHGGVFTPHTRHSDYRWPVDDPKDFGYGRAHHAREDVYTGRYHGLVEAVETARNSGVRLLIAHITPAYAVYQPHPDSLEQAIALATIEEMVDKPRREGLDVTMNVFACPFSAGGRGSILQSLYSSLMKPPQWLASLSNEQLVEKLKTPAFRAQMKSLAYSGLYKFGMLPPRMDPYWADCYTVSTHKVKEYEGKTIGQIARARNPRWTLDAIFNQVPEAVWDIVVSDPESTWDLTTDKREHPIFLSAVLNHAYGMPIGDSVSCPPVLKPGFDLPPRTYYGLYPFYIDYFVKQRKDLSLEKAIRQATSVPADVLGVKGRGVIRTGNFADLVLFDLNKFHLSNTYGEPAQPTDGLVATIVNGKVAFEGGKHTGARSGQVLRHS